MKQLKPPNADDHLLSKVGSQFSHEAILISLGDDEYCAIDLETNEGVICEDELVCCDSTPELLGEI